MRLDATTCKEEYIKQLEGIPHEWKCTIAEAMCSIMDSALNVQCEQVQECETVTELSNFTVDGSEVCITYTNEDSVEVTRCFDFSTVVNSSLDDVDPGCLTDETTWESLSMTERWQLIVDKVCEDCD